ncbi:unnamed protein product, partial [Owenia fusiformis]
NYETTFPVFWSRQNAPVMQTRRPILVILCVLLFQKVAAFSKRSQRNTKSQYTCSVSDLDEKSLKVVFQFKCDCQGTPHTDKWTYDCNGILTTAKNTIQKLDSKINIIEVLDLSSNNIFKLKNDVFSDDQISQHLTVLRLSKNIIKKLTKP